MDATQRHRAIRWLRNGVIAFAALYATLLLFVHVSEIITRDRSERLLAEMRELQVGKSTWADLQSIRTRWGKWGDYEGSCTEQHCAYTVSFADVPGDWRFSTLASFLGHGHMARVFLRVSLDKELVKQTSFELWVQVPKGYGSRWERNGPQDPGYIPYSTGEYKLIAKASSFAKLTPLCCYWPDPVPHPTYVLTRPSGCEGCLAIWTEFLPQASSEDQLRLTNFNLGCITSWKPCADEEDIMPSAGVEYDRERQSRMLRWRCHDVCQTYSINKLSTAALNAAVVRVDSVPYARNQPLSAASVKLLRKLGGPAVWNRDQVVGMEVAADDPLISEAFKDRKPLIVLFPEGPRENLLEPYRCGVLPYSQENEKKVAIAVSLGKGIADPG